MRRDESPRRNFVLPESGCSIDSPLLAMNALQNAMVCPGTTLMSYLSCFIPHNRSYSGQFCTTAGCASATNPESTTRSESSHSRRWGNILLVTVGGQYIPVFLSPTFRYNHCSPRYFHNFIYYYISYLSIFFLCTIPSRKQPNTPAKKSRALRTLQFNLMTLTNERNLNQSGMANIWWAYVSKVSAPLGP